MLTAKPAGSVISMNYECQGNSTITPVMCSYVSEHGKGVLLRCYHLPLTSKFGDVGGPRCVRNLLMKVEDERDKHSTLPINEQAVTVMTMR